MNNLMNTHVIIFLFTLEASYSVLNQKVYSYTRGEKRGNPDVLIINTFPRKVHFLGKTI